jgi:hypothetical protein
MGIDFLRELLSIAELWAKFESSCGVAIEADRWCEVG